MLALLQHGEPLRDGLLSTLLGSASEATMGGGRGDASRAIVADRPSLAGPKAAITPGLVALALQLGAVLASPADGAAGE